MELALDAEQRALVSVARDFLGHACPPDVVRGSWDGEAISALREGLVSVGFVGLPVPVEYGGLGLGDLEMALLLEECGRVALPLPLLESLVAAMTLTESGTPAQQALWLPGIASGKVSATVQPEGQPLVVGAGQADLLIAVIDGEVHALPSDRFDAERQVVVDRSRHVYTVVAAPGIDTLMSKDPAVASRLGDRAAVASAAFLVGLAASLLDTTVSYVKQRQQFGRPIGSFQAVKHRLAQTHLLVETARPAVWSAAHLLACRAEDGPIAASIAKVHSSLAEAAANEHALQCHGGIGFAWEHDLHLWLKRGKALEHAYGSPQWHRRRVADHLFGSLTT